ncbi:aminoacyl-tRNA hydrolase [Candidatus Woesebacteria bacterium]|nr:aminoacyl-tRNA hydrolase [Candidatus Woesebacteria bacterium]
MKIVVGLGNPGKEYERSRHNAGFMVVDQVAQRLGCQFNLEKDYFAEIAKTADFTLIKPQTFMNDSGRALRAWLQFYKKIDQSGEYPELAVIYDDLDIPFGSWKWQFGTGPKAHNGVQSISTHLGSDQFWHGRVGTENRENHRSSIPSDAYVLTPFTSEEQPTVEQVISASVDRLLGKW